MIMEREVAFSSKVADAAKVLDSISLPSLPEESDELVKKRSRGVGLKWEPHLDPTGEYSPYVERIKNILKCRLRGKIVVSRSAC